MLPLVTALARSERLLLDVYEPRQRQHKLCAAIWPRVQSESGSCFHRHQIWSVLRELYSVGHPCLPTHSFSVFEIYSLCCDCDVHVTFFFLCRSLIIKCSSYRQAHWWSHEINRLAETCDFLKVQRFDGFAPPRENTLTKWSDTQSAWHPKLETSISDCFKLQTSISSDKPLCFTVVVWRYVNGSGYFADLADALEQAREEIFITDWWYV